MREIMYPHTIVSASCDSIRFYCLIEIFKQMYVASETRLLWINNLVVNINIISKLKYLYASSFIALKFG